MNNIIYILSCFVFCLFINFSFAQPANNLCGDAIEITDLDGTCNSYTSAGATSTGNPYLATCFDNNETVWFSFTAEGPNVDITVSGSNNQLERPEIGLIGFPLASDGTGDLCDIDDVVQYGCRNPNGNYVATTLSVDNNSLVIGWTYIVIVTSRDQGAFEICIDNPENTSPTTCANAEPFCTADGSVTYEAGVDDGSAQPGNNYDCLITQPNPAWFFLEIDEPGDIEITMESNPAEDIDYVMWGPFNDVEEGCGDLTGDNVVDCSFLALTTEVGTITGAQTGEIYILMITNFSNNETDVIFSQTDGGGSTSCEIVLLPIDLLSFDTYNSKRINHINWVSSSETNNDYFTVEHSIDGISWVEISKIKGQGNSYIENEYSIVHEDYSVNEINYYRLTQYDFNGAMEELGERAVDNRLNIEVVKTVNLLGQEVDESHKGVVIEYYSDGTTAKKMQR